MVRSFLSIRYYPTISITTPDLNFTVKYSSNTVILSMSLLGHLIKYDDISRLFTDEALLIGDVFHLFMIKAFEM